MTLSVIIPVYNKKATLRRAVESVINQGLTPDEYELLLIDDGSTDGSSDLCEQLEKEHPETIKTWFKQNEGVGPTRNFGIHHSQGEYVCFVDADDYLREGGFRDFKDHFYDNKYDVLSYFSTTVREGHEEVLAQKEMYGEIKYETTGHQLLGQGKHLSFIWNSWYKKAFLLENSIFFEPFSYGEDLLFNINLLYANPTIRQTSSFIYVYLTYRGDNQLSKNRDKEKTTTNVLNFVKIFERMGEISQTMLQDIYPCDMGAIFESSLSTFTSRLLSSNISVSQLREIKERIETSCISYRPLKSKMAKASQLIIHSGYIFPMLKYVYCHLFVPYLLPIIDRETGKCSF